MDRPGRQDGIDRRRIRQLDYYTIGEEPRRDRTIAAKLPRDAQCRLRSSVASSPAIWPLRNSRKFPKANIGWFRRITIIGRRIWIKQADSILRALNSSHNGTMITAPRLTLFNGQRAYVLVSRQSAFIESFVNHPATTTQPASFDPHIGLVTIGVLLDVQATASLDRKAVTVTVRPQTASLQGFTPQRWSESPPGQDLIVQIPHQDLLEAEFTTAIPDGQVAIYRTQLKHEPPSTTQPVGEAVMLMIKPTLIIQREIPRINRHPATQHQQPAPPLDSPDPPRRICHLLGIQRQLPPAPPSSSGLGHGPLKAATRVRLPLGVSPRRRSQVHESASRCKPMNFQHLRPSLFFCRITILL